MSRLFWLGFVLPFNFFLALFAWVGYVVDLEESYQLYYYTIYGYSFVATLVLRLDWLEMSRVKIFPRVGGALVVAYSIMTGAYHVVHGGNLLSGLWTFASFAIAAGLVAVFAMYTVALLVVMAKRAQRLYKCVRK